MKFILFQIIGRVNADPDYLPRSSDFGLNQNVFREKFCSTCPEPFYKIAFLCCDLLPDRRYVPMFIIGYDLSISSVGHDTDQNCMLLTMNGIKPDKVHNKLVIVICCCRVQTQRPHHVNQSLLCAFPIVVSCIYWSYNLERVVDHQPKITSLLVQVLLTEEDC